MKWTSLGNGALLEQAATAFDVLLTADQNIEFQQNLATLPIAVVVLVADSNRLPTEQQGRTREQPRRTPRRRTRPQRS